MGFLDDLAGGADLGSIAQSVTGNSDLMNAAKSLLDPDDTSVGGAAGIQDILGALQSSGLGDQVSSWLSSGENMPISASQLQGVLDNDLLRQFAEKAGIDLDGAAGALAKVLPMLIDKLSPDGNASSGDALKGLLSGLG